MMAQDTSTGLLSATPAVSNEDMPMQPEESQEISEADERKRDEVVKRMIATPPQPKPKPDKPKKKPNA